MTTAMATRAGSCGLNTGSIRTVPVKYAAGPRLYGCEPDPWSSSYASKGEAAPHYLHDSLRSPPSASRGTDLRIEPQRDDGVVLTGVKNEASRTGKADRVPEQPHSGCTVLANEGPNLA